MSARQYLTDIYLHWLNDFLSVAAFAEYHGITDAQCRRPNHPGPRHIQHRPPGGITWTP